MLLRRVLRSLALPLPHEAHLPSRAFRSVPRQLLLAPSLPAAPTARSTLLRLTPRALQLRAQRALSSSASDGPGLVSILEREQRLEAEEESKQGGSMTPDLLELKDMVTQQMEIGEEPGSNLVTLTMDFEADTGREKVKVFFNVQEYQEDEGLEDEPASDAPGNIYPFEVRILKKGSIMRFFCQASAQQFTVENVVVSKGEDLDADFDDISAYAYQGPSFDDLEPDLQQAFMDFLHARYVDDTLACFIAGFADYKEQQNYLAWLEDSKQFLA